MGLSEQIMAGMDEAEKKKLATDEQTEGSAVPPGKEGVPPKKELADGTVGEDGAPVYPEPGKKTDEQLAQKPGDVLNEEVARDMGAPDSIEDAIKRVVKEAIKEASTPEGHVNPQAVEQMGAAKMSRMAEDKEKVKVINGVKHYWSETLKKWVTVPEDEDELKAKMSRMGVGSYREGDEVRVTESQPNIPSGKVVTVVEVDGDWLIVKYQGREYKIEKGAVVEWARMSQMAAGDITPAEEGEIAGMAEEALVILSNCLKKIGNRKTSLKQPIQSAYNALGQL